MELGELLVESDWAAAMEYLKTVSSSVSYNSFEFDFYCVVLYHISSVVLYKFL